MNVELLEQIAAWLDDQETHRRNIADGAMIFYMGSFADKHGCGTTACVAGAAICFNNPEMFTAYLNGSLRVNGQPFMVDEAARDALGLDQEQAVALFFGRVQGVDQPATASISDGGFGVIGAPWAARCIRRLIATGIVDWHGTEHGE